MEHFEVTRLGERGQIVIPQEFRKSMKLHTGEKFMVVERNDTLVFKRMTAPTIEDFSAMIKKGHDRAKRLNLKPKDLEAAIKRSRTKK